MTHEGLRHAPERLGAIGDFLECVLALHADLRFQVGGERGPRSQWFPQALAV